MTTRSTPGGRHGGGPPLDPQVPSEQRWCPTCATTTEHRRHRVGKRRDGTPRSRWNCRWCHNRTNRPLTSEA